MSVHTRIAMYFRWIFKNRAIILKNLRYTYSNSQPFYQKESEFDPQRNNKTKRKSTKAESLQVFIQYQWRCYGCFLLSHSTNSKNMYVIRKLFYKLRRFDGMGASASHPHHHGFAFLSVAVSFRFPALKTFKLENSKITRKRMMTCHTTSPNTTATAMFSLCSSFLFLLTRLKEHCNKSQKSLIKYYTRLWISNGPKRIISFLLSVSLHSIYSKKCIPHLYLNILLSIPTYCSKINKPCTAIPKRVPNLPAFFWDFHYSSFHFLPSNIANWNPVYYA